MNTTFKKITETNKELNITRTANLNVKTAYFLLSIPKKARSGPPEGAVIGLVYNC